MQPPPLNVIDVGAYGGADPDWGRIGQMVHFFGFEPNPEEAQRLTQAANGPVQVERFYPYAIAGTQASRSFYLTKSPRCASLLKPNNTEWHRFGEPGTLRNTRADVIETLTLDTVTLDTFCDEQAITPHMVKLDTQGTEYEILTQGFTRHLNEVLALEVEVEFIELYQGQALFSEIEQFLRANGFRLVGLKRHRWKMHDGHHVPAVSGGLLVYGDALFMRDFFVADSLTVADRWRVLALCRRYGLNDLLHALIKHYQMDVAYVEQMLAGWVLKPTISWKSRLKRTLQRFRQRVQSRQQQDQHVAFDDSYGF